MNPVPPAGGTATVDQMRRSHLAKSLVASVIASLLVVAAPSAALAATTSTGIRCTIVGTARSETLRGTAGNDVICGRGGDDVILGGAGNDIIDGGAGKDVLRGEAGDDRLLGGGGNDALFGGTGSDTLTGGPGSDTANYSDRNVSLSLTIDGLRNDGSYGESDLIATTTENLVGGSQDDVLIGHDGLNRLYGGGGDDLMDAGPGDDYLNGQTGADDVDGGAGRNVCAAADHAGDVVALTCDSVGPRFRTLTWTPTVIDTASSSREVVFTARITDDLAGFHSGMVMFEDPLGVPRFSASVAEQDRISGDERDGVYRFVVHLPVGMARTTFRLARVWSIDKTLNQAGSDDARTDSAIAEYLAALGSPGTLTQIGTPPPPPPRFTGTIASLAVSPSRVDTSSSARTVHVALRLTSAVGVSAVVVSVDAPTGAAAPSPVLLTPVDGDPRLFEGDLEVRRWSAPGAYALSVWVHDAFTTHLFDPHDLTARGLTSSFTQIGAGDTTGPELLGMTVSPRIVNTRDSAREVTITVDVRDTLSGLIGTGSFGTVFGGPQWQMLVPRTVSCTSTSVAGDGRILRQTCQYVMTVPRYAQTGRWVVNPMAKVVVTDAAGTSRRYSPEQIAALGYHGFFDVVNN